MTSLIDSALNVVARLVTSAVTSAGLILQQRPWVVLVVAAVVALFIITRRR